MYVKCGTLIFRGHDTWKFHHASWILFPERPRRCTQCIVVSSWLNVVEGHKKNKLFKLHCQLEVTWFLFGYYPGPIKSLDPTKEWKRIEEWNSHVYIANLAPTDYSSSIDPFQAVWRAELIHLISWGRSLSTFILVRRTRSKVWRIEGFT
jgi:hypothetical protein